MSRPSFQFALRALQQETRSPLFWSACGTAALILAVSGPFSTLDTLPAFFPRLAYWAFVVFATYVIGLTATMTVQPAVEGRPFALRALVQGACVGALVAPTIMSLNWLVLGVSYPSYGAAGIFAALLVLISLGVTSVMIMTLPLRAKLEQVDAAEKTHIAEAEREPVLVTRLPIEKRGRLVAITSEDHHVRIQTTQGEHWLRMRLVDAIDAAAPTEGLQVHRSHWVATDAITRVAREGKGARLTLSHGPTIPVSRGHIAALRDIGLLS